MKRTRVVARPARWWLERAVRRYARKGWIDMGVRGKETIGSITWWLTIMLRKRGW